MLAADIPAKPPPTTMDCKILGDLQFVMNCQKNTTEDGSGWESMCVVSSGYCVLSVDVCCVVLYLHNKKGQTWIIYLAKNMMNTAWAKTKNAGKFGEINKTRTPFWHGVVNYGPQKSPKTATCRDALF